MSLWYIHMGTIAAREALAIEAAGSSELTESDDPNPLWNQERRSSQPRSWGQDLTLRDSIRSAIGKDTYENTHDSAVDSSINSNHNSAIGDTQSIARKSDSFDDARSNHDNVIVEGLRSHEGGSFHASFRSVDTTGQSKGMRACVCERKSQTECLCVLSVFVCLHVCASVYLCVYMFVHLCILVFTCLCICVFVYLYVCASVYLCVYLFVHLCICVCV